MTHFEKILLTTSIVSFIIGAIGFCFDLSSLAGYSAVVTACSLAMLMTSGFTRSKSNIFDRNKTNINITIKTNNKN